MTMPRKTEIKNPIDDFINNSVDKKINSTNESIEKTDLKIDQEIENETEELDPKKELGSIKISDIFSENERDEKRAHTIYISDNIDKAINKLSKKHKSSYTQTVEKLLETMLSSLGLLEK